MGSSQRVSKPSFYKSQETAPKPSQRVSKAHRKKLAEIQTAVSISQFLLAGTVLYVTGLWINDGLGPNVSCSKVRYEQTETTFPAGDMTGDFSD